MAEFRLRLDGATMAAQKFHLSLHCRLAVVNYITNSIETIFAVSSIDLIKLRRIVDTFEEKMYTTAADRLEYLQKISRKLLFLEEICQPRVYNDEAPVAPLTPLISSSCPGSMKKKIVSRNEALRTKLFFLNAVKNKRN